MKTNIYRILLSSIFILLFNVLFFLLSGFENPNSVWLSYGFVNFSYIILLLTPVLCTKGNNSYYLSAAIYTQVVSYFVIELIIGIVFIICRLESLTWPLVIQGVLWAIYMVVILMNAWANESTQQSLAQRQDDMAAFQLNRLNLKKLVLKVDDPEIKNLLVLWQPVDKERKKDVQMPPPSSTSASLSNTVWSCGIPSENPNKDRKRSQCSDS